MENDKKHINQKHIYEKQDTLIKNNKTKSKNLPAGVSTSKMTLYIRRFQGA